MIERFNRSLADHGALYELDGDIYFARSADPAFGSVARLDAPTMLALAAERGGDPGRPGKKDPLDPLVWVAGRAGEPSWASEFGAGRPGWHVECAAIAAEYLGASFDVQAGGTDLAFPHHEMSASHARVALGGGRPAAQVFARCYVHSGMVRLDGEKMSKSRGNLVFVSRLLAAGVDPMAIRLAILAHHYAHDWDWTQEGLAAAADRLARWRGAVALASAAVGPWHAEVPPARDVLTAVRDRLADDLDAPGALAAVDSWTAAVVTAAGSSMPGPGGPVSGPGVPVPGPGVPVPGPGGSTSGAGGLAPAAGASADLELASAGRLVSDLVDALLGIAL